jgi:ParB/RepB/Spo0J family partition protein
MGREPADLEVPLDAIVPDPANRPGTDDEEFRALTDSVRVLGVLERLKVRQRADGGFDLFDGERRWRAARAAGLAVVPVRAWPEEAPMRDIIALGVALNEHRKAHGALHVARRLRQIKNQFAESHEQVAARTGMPLDRVKSYFALFGASDQLLELFDADDVPLRVAVEFMRFEKAAGEVAARRLIRQHEESPLTLQDLVTLRKRHHDRKDVPPADASARRRTDFAPRIEAAFRKDPRKALEELQAALRRLGFRVVEEKEAV